MNLGDMSVGADPEELFICPYDQSHVIRKKIIPYHLMKCRKNWTGKELKTCPFNSDHEIAGPEYAGHLVMCEDKYIIEKDLESMKKSIEVPVKHPEPDTEPENTEDWDRDIRVEQKLNRVRPPGHFVSAPGMVDLSCSLNSMALHPYYTSKDVSVSERKISPRVDVSDNSFHRTREPSTTSMAYGDGRGRRDDLGSTRSHDTTLDVSNEGDFAAMNASFQRGSGSNPCSRPQFPQSFTVGSGAWSAAPTPPPFRPLGRGALMQTVTANPGAIANGNRSSDNPLDTSRSSGFGVGLRSTERGVGGFSNGLNGRSSRDPSLERPFSGSFGPAPSMRGANSADQRNGLGENPYGSMGRGQSIRGV